MIRPDALPVVPLDPSATLDGPSVAALFGKGYRLTGSERIGLSRLGREAGPVPVAAGPLALTLDRPTCAALGGTDGLRLVGPCGNLAAPRTTSAVSRVVLPSGLRSAWGVPACATVALGDLAARLPVEDGPAAAVHLDRALWTAAGEPAVARWLPGVDWPAADAPETKLTETEAVVPRRVVTENDVRQARLHHRQITLAPGQIVTPAAQSLAREWGVFATPVAQTPAGESNATLA